MVPAQQCFHSQQAPGAQAQLGLVKDFQFVLGQGAAQVVFNEQLIAGFGVQCFGKDLHLVFAIGLGLVQGKASVLHQSLWVATMQGRARQAYGAGDVDQLIIDEHGFVEGLEYLARNFLAAFKVGVIEQYREFVTGKARQATAWAQAVAQAPGQADQQLVAGLVAEAVVDALEVVDVHQQQADGRIAVAGEALVEVANE
ncbi:hypothetical protein D9M71_578370 [compost metagenome]